MSEKGRRYYQLYLPDCAVQTVPKRNQNQKKVAFTIPDWILQERQANKKTLQGRVVQASFYGVEHIRRIVVPDDSNLSQYLSKKRERG